MGTRGLYQAVEGPRSDSRTMAPGFIRKGIWEPAHQGTVPGSQRGFLHANEPRGHRGKGHREQFPERNGEGEDAGRFQPDLLAHPIQADPGQATALRHNRKPAGQGNRGTQLCHLVGRKRQRAGRGLRHPLLGQRKRLGQAHPDRTARNPLGQRATHSLP